MSAFAAAPLRRDSLRGGLPSRSSRFGIGWRERRLVRPASTLMPYGDPLTVGGELDKLASNISIGRDTAGVHWRSDGVEGMRLGEHVAIAVLADLRGTFNESFVGFSFKSFDGATVTI